MITMLALLIRARWGAWLISFVLAGVVGALAAAGAAYPGHTGDDIAARDVAAAPIGERSFRLSADVNDSNALSNQLNSIRGLTGMTVLFSSQLETLGFTQSAPTTLLYREDLCPHIKLRTGRCPIVPGEVVVPAAEADRQGVHTGDRLDLAEANFLDKIGWVPSPDGSHPFDVVGVYTPVNPAEDYWGTGSPFHYELDGTLIGPMLTQADSIEMLPRTAESQYADVIVNNSYLEHTTWPQIQDVLRDQMIDPPTEGLPDLMQRLDAERHYLTVMTPAVVLPILGLGCLVLFLLASRRVQQEGTELGVQSVRGLPLPLRWWLAAGPPITAVVLGCLVGAAATGAPFAFTVGLALVVALASVALASLPTVTARPVDALRRVGPSFAARLRSLPVAEVVLLALAIASLGLARTGDTEGFGVYAPALLGAAVAVALARLVPPLLRVGARGALGRGRLTTGLALAQLSRRPAARQLVALTGLAVALLALVAAAMNTAVAVRDSQVSLAMGADRVLTVHATEPGRVLAAVDKVDPGGHFALAAGRMRTINGLPDIMAVDMTRAKLLPWPAAPAIASHVVAPAGPDRTLAGSTVDLTLAASVVGGKNRSPVVTVELSARTADGTRTVITMGVAAAGEQTLTATMPKECSGGCRLEAIVARGSQTQGWELQVGKLTSGDAVISDFGQWRVAGSLNDTDATWPVGGEGGRSESWLVPPETPSAVNAAVTPDLHLDERKLRITGPGGADPGPRVTSTVETPVLPRLGNRGILVDLRTLSRATDGAHALDSMEVWLSSAAPADVVKQLASAGVVVSAESSRATALDQANHTPEALTLRLHVVGAAIAWLLLAAVLLVAAGLDRGSPDQNALRWAGVRASTMRRSWRVAYAAIVLIGSLCGIVAAVVAWALARSVLPLGSTHGWAAPPALPGFEAVAVPVGVAALGLIVLTWLAFARSARAR
jgi:putative ABC transport system permease protein